MSLLPHEGLKGECEPAPPFSTRVVSVPRILLDGMSAVVERASAVSIAIHEVSSTSDIAPLFADVSACLEDALGATRLALACYDDDGTAPALLDGGKVAGVAFVARMELRQHQQRLGAARAPERRGEILDACDDARRCVLKSLRALERAMREAEGLPNDTRGAAVELERSLLTRRAYVAFHREVVRDVRGRPAGARVRLRCARAAIERLLTSEVGPWLRPGDRQILKRTDDRISACLRADRASDRGSPSEANQIYADLESAAELMLGINRREELVDHDRRALTDASTCIARLDLHRMLERLRTIEGRDFDLDARVKSPAGVSVEIWERLLRDTRARLDGVRSAAPEWGDSLR